MAVKPVTPEEYNTTLQPAWCPGCGNFGILNAVRQALVQLEIAPHQVLFVSGIGQAGKLPHYTKGNVFNSLHGRPLSPAIGAKIANSELTVIAVSGDGDAYGEGGNHFLHSMRRNHNITYLVHDNQLYDTGYISKTTPPPSGAPPSINPLALAITAGATFVGRGFAGDIPHLVNLMKQGIRHKGFALIDILQPCVTFNHVNTFAWYKERVYKLEDVSGYDAGNKITAFEKAQEWGERIPIGIIYQREGMVFEESLPALARGTLVRQEVAPDRQKLEHLLDEFL
jgi:2-oxoglutarate ferredoxin oxidoreductase subunit beta